jgi:hypothetical protein
MHEVQALLLLEVLESRACHVAAGTPEMGMDYDICVLFHRWENLSLHVDVPFHRQEPEVCLLPRPLRYSSLYCFHEMLLPFLVRAPRPGRICPGPLVFDH